MHLKILLFLFLSIIYLDVKENARVLFTCLTPQRYSMWSYLNMGIILYYSLKQNFFFQNFGNRRQNLVAPNAFLLRSWRWQTMLNCEMLELPDTLQELLSRFASVAWCTALESTVFGLSDLAWLFSLLKPEWNLMNCTFICSWMHSLRIHSFWAVWSCLII